MTLYQSILSDLKAAMLKKDAGRLAVLRSIKTAVERKEINERKGGEAKLTDDQVMDVLMKAAKQRKESIEQYEKYDRDDLAATEKEELAIIESYLPQMMSEEDIRDVIRQIIKETGASSLQDMGKVMGSAMPRLKGKAEGSLINKIVKDELAG